MLPRSVVPCLLLAACSIWSNHPSLTSSVRLGPGERTTLRVQAVPPSTLTLELQGERGGAIAFDAHTPAGAPMASGVLGCGTQVRCLTSEGELVVEFTATAEAGSVAYVARSSTGLSVTLTPHQ